MTLKSDLQEFAARVEAFASKCEGTFGKLPDPIRTDAGALVGDLKKTAESAADGVVEKVAGPTFGPEIVAVINQALDEYSAKIVAEAAAKTDAITAAKAQLAAAPQ
ncbi:MAG: hypothetical protein ACRDL8_00385 [Solirubrobacteraceae bacterium]